MSTELAVINPINPSTFPIPKRQLYYAKDDSCIATTSSRYTKAHDLEEFSSLFKKTRRCSHTLVVDVSFELEVMRNSLGKIAMQRRMDRRCSQDSTYSTGSHNSATSILSEEDNSCPLSPKVHQLLWELENCLVKIQQSDGDTVDTASTDLLPHTLEADLDPIPSASAQLITKSVSMTTFTASMPSVPVTAFLSRGPEVANDKTSEILDASVPTISSQKSHTARNNVTVSEVYIIATLAGWILKLSSTSFFSLKSWKRRFLVLTPTTLFRFKSSAPGAIVDEYLELTPETIACVTDKFTGKRWVLEITTPSKPSWYIQTESLDELKTWLNALKASVIRAKYCNNRLPSSGSFSIPSTKQDVINGLHSLRNSRRDSASTQIHVRTTTAASNPSIFATNAG
ncbi:hypothetical protein K7432_012218 [Basidiobolus ranarum]|uniref:PH domain-containing protein n=1 Tax=Basidiobolus ranarum TaxID=34480 RepID=A0ABR2VTH0_9FUNG